MIAFWLIPGVLLINFCYAYRLTLTSEKVTLRNFFWSEKTIQLSDITGVDSTYTNTLLIASKEQRVKIFDVFADHRYITDFIVKRIDKTWVSTKVMND